MGVHDLNFRKRICDTFGFVEPEVGHEYWQDAVCSSHGVRGPWKTFGRIIDRHNGDAGVRTLGCADLFRVSVEYSTISWGLSPP